jgi:hypothetical protein
MAASSRSGQPAIRSAGRALSLPRRGCIIAGRTAPAVDRGARRGAWARATQHHRLHTGDQPIAEDEGLHSRQRRVHDYERSAS